MANQRRVIGLKEKAKIAIAAIKEQKTTRELSTQFKVHVTQIGVWKKKLLEEASEIFERDYKRFARARISATRIRTLPRDWTPEDGNRMAQKKAANFE